METRALTKAADYLPTVFSDFFKPWNEWFDNGFPGRSLNIPSVNISEHKDEFQVSLAVPGLKKDDFKIDMEGNMLTISCEKEQNKEEKDKKFTRREYNYSSFSRSFTLPDDINKDKIEARYEDGILRISLPRKVDAAKLMTKQIAVK